MKLIMLSLSLIANFLLKLHQPTLIFYCVPGMRDFRVINCVPKIDFNSSI